MFKVTFKDDYKLLTTNVHLRKQGITLMTNYPKSGYCKNWIISVELPGNFQILNLQIFNQSIDVRNDM